MKAGVLILPVAVLSLAGCQPHADVEPEPVAAIEAPKPLDPDSVVRIGLYRDGHIEIDGAATAGEDVSAKLKAAADAAKSAVFYREQERGMLSREQKSALYAILGPAAEHHLPVRYSTNADFSDTLSAPAKSSAS